MEATLAQHIFLSSQRIVDSCRYPAVFAPNDHIKWQPKDNPQNNDHLARVFEIISSKSLNYQTKQVGKNDDLRRWMFVAGTISAAKRFRSTSPGDLAMEYISIGIAWVNVYDI